MQGLVIYNKAGAAITSEEIEAAHRVANTHGNIKSGTIIVTDKLTEVLVEYFPFKNFCFTTPSSSIPMSFIYRMEGSYEELVNDGTYVMLPGYDKITYTYSLSVDITLYENKKRIRLDGLDANGITLPYNDFLDSDGRIVRFVTYNITDNKFYGLANTSQLGGSDGYYLKLLIVNDLNAAGLAENHLALNIPLPSTLPGSYVSFVIIPPLMQGYFVDNLLYIPLFYQYYVAPDFKGNENLVIYTINLDTLEISQADVAITASFSSSTQPSTTIFGGGWNRSVSTEIGVYTAANFLQFDGEFNLFVRIYRQATLLGTYPLLFHPEDPSTPQSDVMWSIADIQATKSGNHYICIFSESDYSNIYAAVQEANNYFYVVLDDVKQTFSPVSYLSRVVDGLDFYEFQNTFFGTLIAINGEDRGGNDNRISISEAGNWCACLLSSGYSRSNIDGSVTITVNIIRIVNGLMLEEYEVIDYKHSPGFASAFIINDLSLNFFKSFITPDDLYAITLSPVFVNGALGSSFSSDNPEFNNQCFDDSLMKVSVYSLETSALISESVIETSIQNEPSSLMFRTMGGDTISFSKFRITTKGSGYRIEIASDLYSYIDVLPSEDGFKVSEPKLYATSVNPLSNVSLQYNIPGLASGNRQLRGIYEYSVQRLSNFYP